MTLQPLPRSQALQPSQPLGKLELKVCTHRTCKHQGSKQIHKFLADLHLEQVDIGETGCLGNCGNGPNMLLVGTKLAPSGTRLAHISTPARAASALRTFADISLDAQLVKSTELRLAGNAAVRAGDLHKAIALYSEALDLQPSTGSHLLLSNRSAAKLAVGNAEGALADAASAIDCAPADYITAYVRQVEALLHLQRPTEALQELLLAGDRHPEYAATPEYRSLLKQVQR